MLIKVGGKLEKELLFSNILIIQCPRPVIIFSTKILLGELLQVTILSNEYQTFILDFVPVATYPPPAIICQRRAASVTCARASNACPPSHVIRGPWRARSPHAPELPSEGGSKGRWLISPAVLIRKTSSDDGSLQRLSYPQKVSFLNEA